MRKPARFAARASTANFRSAVIGILSIYFSSRLTARKVQIAPLRMLIPGLFPILNALGSRAPALVLGVSGLPYAIIGVFRLGVSLYAAMFLGASSP